MLFCDLLALFLKYTREHRKKRTADFYAHQLARVNKKYGQMDAMELRPVHLLEFRQTWHLILAVQRLYRWSTTEYKILPSNPMIELKRPRLRARQRILERHELARGLRAAGGDFRRFLLCLRETACRPQEACALTWQDIHCEVDARGFAGALRAGRAYFLLLDYKGRDRRAEPNVPRIIPISPRLGRLMARMLKSRSRSGLIFTTQDGRPWHKDLWRARFKRMCERARIERVKRGERLVTYTVRHTSATNYADAGMQTSVLQLLLGHASINTTQRYLHIQKKHLLDAWKRHHDKKRGDDGQAENQS